MRGIEGRVAFVTGGSSGIGRAVVHRLVDEGAVVASFDAAPDPSDTPAALVIEGDVRDEDAVSGALARVTDELGVPQILVNSAGVAGGGPTHLLPVEEWERVMGINLVGTVLPCKHFTAALLTRGLPGAIVNLASIDGLEGAEGASPYAASKGAVVQLTRTLALDYGRRGVRVNAVCPGYTQTPMVVPLFDQEMMAPVKANVIAATPLGRMCAPEEIAAGIAFLASEDASFMTGHCLVIDGGFTAGHRVGIADLFGLG